MPLGQQCSVPRKWPNFSTLLTVTGGPNVSWKSLRESDLAPRSPWVDGVEIFDEQTTSSEIHTSLRPSPRPIAKSMNMTGLIKMTTRY